jgi:hypothetical protein
LSFHPSGAIAALLLLALWYCAALIGGDRDTVTDRLRNAAIAGIALGFVLGLAGLLTPAAYAIALAALCAARFVFRRHAPLSDRVPVQTYFWPAIAVVAVAWPQLVRPLMDGDSLAYHLPNAAGWVHGASLWTTTTRYWWFPPASELFAAGFYLLSGAFSVGLAGTVALLLLGFRLAEWCGKQCGPWAGGAISAATISLPALALQGGNLLNDVWMAAFFVESLFANRFAPENSWRSLATTALIKPIGIAYALIAHVDSPRRFAPALLLCYLPLGAWIVHDIVLWPHAAAANTVTSLTTSQYGHVSTWQTTVLAHGLDGVKTLAAALWHEGFWAIIVTIAALIAPLLIKDRALAFAGYAAFALFFVLPFAYENDSPQLATGHALRLFVPLLVLGAIAASEMVRRYAPVLAAAAIAAAAYNVYRVDAVFWNDATTRALRDTGFRRFGLRAYRDLKRAGAIASALLLRRLDQHAGNQVALFRVARHGASAAHRRAKPARGRDQCRRALQRDVRSEPGRLHAGSHARCARGEPGRFGRRGSVWPADPLRWARRSLAPVAKGGPRRPFDFGEYGETYGYRPANRALCRADRAHARLYHPRDAQGHAPAQRHIVRGRPARARTLSD